MIDRQFDEIAYKHLYGKEPEMVDIDDLPDDACNIQYASIDGAIKAHAEDYSFNIESELFQQLTPEQQKMWRKEIEQAVISGGYCGLNLATDNRYNQEEFVCEDLKEASWKYEENINDLDARSDNEVVRRAFVAGAKWQKQQMMKDAEEVEVFEERPPHITYFPKNLKGGDKVKLIIIKE